MSHVSLKLGQFAYFDEQLKHPCWHGKLVLDFGGNAGNLLKIPNSPIAEENYWCIDVSPDGIAQGRRSFPRANWILHNAYNVSFNPAGGRCAVLPRIDRLFDFILAYSVFTHIDVAEMDCLIPCLMEMVRPGGAFAFTFIDHNFRSWPDEYPITNLGWRLDRMNMHAEKASAMMLQVANMSWFRLAGDGDVYRENEAMPAEKYEGQPYHVFHSRQFMREHFPGAELLPPVNGEMQHCCVLRKAL